MNFSLFYLLLLVSLLLFRLLKFTLCFILLVLLLSLFPFILNSLTFSFAFFLLSSVLFVAVVPFQKLLLSFVKPSNIANQSLLKLILNHLCVVLFFGGKLSIFNCFDLVPDFILLVSNLFKLLFIGLLCIFNLFLLAFDLINTFLDAVNHLLNLRQRLWLFFLTLTQQIYFVLNLLLLLNQWLRIFYLFNLSNNLPFFLWS